jgi:hypothetical protein
MDELIVGSNNEHVYDFNGTTFAGGTKLTEVWDGISLEDGYTATGMWDRDQNHKKYHEDQIVLMTESNTSRFGYKNSIDSKDHFEYIVLEIDGAYYVGFDFWCTKDWNDDNTALKNGVTFTNPDGSVKGYLEGDKDTDRDHIYTDWIVKITPAIKKGSGTPTLRVMAEDLSANEPSDFDFNDVVFDVEYVNASKVNVTIQAAGGTLPLKVAGREVHDLLNNANHSPNSAAYWDKASNAWVENQPIDVKTMINTNARRIKPESPYKAADGLSSTTFELAGSWSDNQNTFAAQVRDNIKVEVNKGSDGSDNWMELKANQGQPACKIGVPITKSWAEEKVRVNPNAMAF